MSKYRMEYQVDGKVECEVYILRYDIRMLTSSCTDVDTRCKIYEDIPFMVDIVVNSTRDLIRDSIVGRGTI